MQNIQVELQANSDSGLQEDKVTFERTKRNSQQI